jgi:nucleoside-diphosphate-sugar epimerase
MRVLIVGANGFLGGRIAAELINAGHDVIPCGRDLKRLQRLYPFAMPIACDFAKDGPAEWGRRIESVDGVVNAAGIFRSSKSNDFQAVHASGPSALFEACAAARITKVIQISALGAGPGARTPFHRTKAAADDYCMKRAQEQDLKGWTVIRPSLVIGRGGQSTALFSALAALPWPPRLADGTWEVQPIHAADLAHGVRLLLGGDRELPPILDFVGPSPMTTSVLTQTLRRWLGLSPASQIPLPEWTLRSMIPLSRLFSFNALSGDSLTMLKQGNIAPAAPLAEALDWRPRELAAALASEPSSEADLWHARLYFLRPALRLGLSLIWIATAIVSAFIYPLDRSLQMVSGLGLNGWKASALVYAGAALDGTLGLALLLNYKPAPIGVLQLATVAIFTVLATFAVPQDWIEPLGPLTKNIAVILATLVMIALEARP